MRSPFPYLTLALMAFLLFVTTASAGPNGAAVTYWRAVCQLKNANTVAAINQMCAQDITTGTPQALKGVRVGNSRVTVQSTCHYTKFVPKEWCYAQFMQTCSEGGKKGFGQKRFDGGCQVFLITR